ncbi:hypothetical protein M5689_004980 [Euphorbia peplus]|nr:hypothetical protein M5689_004980 [Euphorbia peplus]
MQFLPLAKESWQLKPLADIVNLLMLPPPICHRLCSQLMACINNFATSRMRLATRQSIYVLAKRYSFHNSGSIQE